MIDLFEIHITVHVKDAAKAEQIAEHLHWKTSQIMGDPILGKKPFCYLTRYAETKEEALAKISSVRSVSEWVGMRILREKIEYTVYDERYEYPEESKA